MSSPLPDRIVKALADLRPISKDPIEFQAGVLVGTIHRYEDAVVKHGVLSDESIQAGDAYELAAKLYAPSLVGALAQQLMDRE